MENGCYTIGNEQIIRTIYFENSVPMKSILKRKNGAMEWVSGGKRPLISIPGISLEGSLVLKEENALIFQGKDFELCWEFRLFEDLPVIESRIGIKCRKNCISQVTDSIQERDSLECVGSESHHVTLTSVEFHDRTDHRDCLLEERTLSLYSRGKTERNGHIFTLHEQITGEECILIKNSPGEETHLNKYCADFYAEGISDIHICASGIEPEMLSEKEYLYSYPVALGLCGAEESIPLFRAYYKKDYVGTAPYIMSNTWGDRNCDKCVCEEFILKEIEKAAYLGIDVVQIDDGWQSGATANSVLASNGVWSGGYREADPDFWKIHERKFPEGFRNISKKAKEKGILLGLWFSPDNYNNYETWELDAETMLDFYRNYDIKYFKIDGVNVENAVCEKNLLKLFRKVSEESDGNITFNMDITAEKRFGYLLHRNMGDIFVENRYTDWMNYYPHNTLKNLWELAKYFPAGRFQMEVLNHKRNRELYGEDCLAPSEYDIEYLFASVMPAKPLLWMEMTGLDEENSKKLADIISVYRKYRDDFEEIIPVMDRPDGFSLTGFRIKGKTQNYVLLFRELCEQEVFPFSVSKVLATNDKTMLQEDRKTIPVSLQKKRSYLFGIEG